MGYHYHNNEKPNKTQQIILIFLVTTLLSSFLAVAFVTGNSVNLAFAKKHGSSSGGNSGSSDSSSSSSSNSGGGSGGSSTSDNSGGVGSGNSGSSGSGSGDNGGSGGGGQGTSGGSGNMGPQSPSTSTSTTTQQTCPDDLILNSDGKCVPKNQSNTPMQTGNNGSNTGTATQMKAGGVTTSTGKGTMTTSQMQTGNTANNAGTKCTGLSNFDPTTGSCTSENPSASPMQTGNTGTTTAATTTPQIKTGAGNTGSTGITTTSTTSIPTKCTGLSSFDPTTGTCAANSGSTPQIGLTNLAPGASTGSVSAGTTDCSNSKLGNSIPIKCLLGGGFSPIAGGSMSSPGNSPTSNPCGPGNSMMKDFPACEHPMNICDLYPNECQNQQGLTNLVLPHAAAGGSTSSTNSQQPSSTNNNPQSAGCPNGNSVGLSCVEESQTPNQQEQSQISKPNSASSKSTYYPVTPPQQSGTVGVPTNASGPSLGSVLVGTGRVIQGLVGLSQCVAGALCIAGGIAASPTGAGPIGVPVGGLLLARGIDNLQAAYSGGNTIVNSAATDIAKTLGAPPTVQKVVGIGADLTADLGAGKLFGAVSKVVFSAPPNPIIDLPRTGSGNKIDFVKPIRNGNNQIIKEFPGAAQAHGFNNIIDNYGKYAKGFTLRPGTPTQATLYQLQGSLNGVPGRFEWIVQDGQVTHRMFVEGGKVNGIPIKP